MIHLSVTVMSDDRQVGGPVGDGGDKDLVHWLDPVPHPCHLEFQLQSYTYLGVGFSSGETYIGLQCKS